MFGSAKDGSDSNAIILPGKRMSKKKGKNQVYETMCLYLSRSLIFALYMSWFVWISFCRSMNNLGPRKCS